MPPTVPSDRRWCLSGPGSAQGPASGPIDGNAPANSGPMRRQCGASATAQPPLQRGSSGSQAGVQRRPGKRTIWGDRGLKSRAGSQAAGVHLLGVDGTLRVGKGPTAPGYITSAKKPPMNRMG